MKYTSVTNLAKMGKCERLVCCDYDNGEDTSLTEKQIKFGNDHHLKMYKSLSRKKPHSWLIMLAIILVFTVIKLLVK